MMLAGTTIGMNEFDYKWTTAQLVKELLPFFAWFGWTLDMLAAELGMLLLVITTWEVEWYFFLYYFPVYFFLLIVAPSWMHAITRLWSRPRLFVCLILAWKCLTFHRATDAQVPWLVEASGYTWGDLVVDCIMSYCMLAGVTGTVKGLASNQMFSMRLSPPWAHRCKVLAFGGLIWGFLGVYDITVASSSYGVFCASIPVQSQVDLLVCRTPKKMTVSLMCLWSLG